MSHDDLPKTCKFGHVFEVYDHNGTGAPHGGIRKKIKEGKIRTLSDVEAAQDGSDSMAGIMGDSYKSLKVSAGSQGTPYMVSWTCADKFDEDLNYTVSKTSEDIFVSPQNQLHDEFMQRKQQAEQRVNQTLSSLSDLRKQKHLLEHDIRKLRARTEAFDTGEEVQLKADFVELVDGAGGGAQQGSDEAPLKTLRDQNLYPSIVADFYEMDGLDDLKRAEQKSEEDADDGKLARIPANEKAILKKKYVMYEKWKDLYGSEVQRKLRDLKSQLKNVERSIEQTEKWLEPYVRDIVMINQEDTESLTDKIDFYPAIRGTATMRRDIEFICYRPMENDGETMTVVEDESEATHYRVIVINSTHVNLSGAEQPNSPAQGPSAAVITYYPAIVCRHVFNNIFRKKMEKNKNRFRDLLKDYTGDFDNEYGEEVKQARVNKNWSVRKLRNEIGDHLGEEVPIELSSYIRRLEDGLDDPQELVDDFGEEYLDAIEEVLGVELGGSAADPDMYEGIGKTLREFTGQVDPYVLPENANPLGDLLAEIKFSYYYDYKLGLGLYTMK